MHTHAHMCARVRGQVLRVEVHYHSEAALPAEVEEELQVEAAVLEAGRQLGASRKWLYQHTPGTA